MYIFHFPRLKHFCGGGSSFQQFYQGGNSTKLSFFFQIERRKTCLLRPRKMHSAVTKTPNLKKCSVHLSAQIKATRATRLVPQEMLSATLNLRPSCGWPPNLKQAPIQFSSLGHIECSHSSSYRAPMRNQERLNSPKVPHPICTTDQGPSSGLSTSVPSHLARSIR